jgi:hypothetical protein
MKKTEAQKRAKLVAIHTQALKANFSKLHVNNVKFSMGSENITTGANNFVWYGSIKYSEEFTFEKNLFY